MKNGSTIGHNLSPYGQRRIGTVNWLGVWTLYVKEVRRFFKVVGQTVFSPIITTALFMTVFTIALDSTGRYVGDVPFALFLAPGLVIMAILQNAFANTISSIMTSKMQGNIIDLLLAPLGPSEMTLAFTLAAVTRGILVGISVLGSMFLFTDIPFPNLWAVFYFGISAAVMLALLGIIAGIWAEKWEQSSSITNFIIVPLSFLSGTFYSIKRLPGIWHDISQMNPFFYLIDGFRYGIIDHAEGNLLIGALYIAVLNIALWLTCYHMLKSGYKLRP
ncbi:MAG: ABC transporter permease [Emcibacter sp.]|nr:ABC transporter permease [Emcibacter sp.]